MEEITPEISRLLDDMLETMYDAEGIGLAAHQVGRPLQITVLDVRDIEDRPSTIEINGQPAAIEEWMPMALINPHVNPHGDLIVGPEGCLSFPAIYSDIPRPSVVDVTAWDRHGATISFRAGGLLARAVQHEVDHLNGILFIDRMSTTARSDIKEEIEELKALTKAASKKR